MQAHRECRDPGTAEAPAASVEPAPRLDFRNLTGPTSTPSRRHHPHEPGLGSPDEKAVPSPELAGEEDPSLVGEHHSMGAVAQAQLPKDAGDVSLDCCSADLAARSAQPRRSRWDDGPADGSQYEK